MDRSSMGLDSVPTGKNPPDEINVIIEIPKDAEPVKYEVDKESGAIFVDRILSTPMRYPCNYGYVPNTVCGDGDPADVLVVLPLPLIPGSVIRCRPVGVLKMTDEAGSDEKILAVPVEKVFGGYAHVDDLDKVSGHWLEIVPRRKHAPGNGGCDNQWQQHCGLAPRLHARPEPGCKAPQPGGRRRSARAPRLLDVLGECFGFGCGSLRTGCLWP